MPPWSCIASRVTHSAARQTYAFTIDACSAPPAFDLAPARLLERERVPGGGLLLDDEQREPAVAGRPVGVGAGEEHEDVGATGERRPRLHAAEEIAALGGRRGDLDVGDVGAVVG